MTPARVARVGQRYPAPLERRLPPSRNRVVMRCAARVALGVILALLLLCGLALVVH